MPITTRNVIPLFEVYDMHKSVAFYRDVLGFEVVSKYEPDGHFYWAMLKLGDATIMLNGRYEDDTRPPQPDPRRTPGHADTELYFGCPNVDEAYTHLVSKGCKVAKPEVTHYGMKELFISDPDGFVLCFQQRVQ